jgi:hypothetical protein
MFSMSTVVEILHEIEALSDSERLKLLEMLLPHAAQAAMASTPSKVEAAEQPDALRKFKTWIGVSPVTGLPVLMAEEGAPQVTSEQVRELLADFP